MKSSVVLNEVKHLIEINAFRVEMFRYAQHDSAILYYQRNTMSC